MLLAFAVVVRRITSELRVAAVSPAVYVNLEIRLFTTIWFSRSCIQREGTIDGQENSREYGYEKRLREGGGGYGGDGPDHKGNVGGRRPRFD